MRPDYRQSHLSEDLPFARRAFGSYCQVGNREARSFFFPANGERWFFIKRQDEELLNTRPIERDGRSASSGRTMKHIPAGMSYLTA